MIKKIDSIKNLAVFKDFIWDNCVTDGVGKPVSLSKVNILYGRNYSGKTTLSRIIRALETGVISDKYGAPEFAVSFDDNSTAGRKNLTAHGKTIRVFNEDFVRENLRCMSNPEDSVTPFAVIVGEDNSRIEQEIHDLEDELGSDESGKETGLFARLMTSERDLKSAIDEHRKAEGDLDRQLTEEATDRERGIRYRSDKYGDQNYNKAKLRIDLGVVLDDAYQPLTPDSEKEFEKLLLERPKPPIPKTRPPELLIRTLSDEARVLMEKRIGDSDKIVELAGDIVLNEWAKKGYELHGGKRTVCAFCGGAISSDRWDALEKHFDEESRSLETRISRLLDRITQHREQVGSSLVADRELFYAKFSVSLEEVISRLSSAISKYKAQLDLLISQLRERAGSVTRPVEFREVDDCSKEFADALAMYESLGKEANGYTQELSKQQANARQLLRLHRVYTFASTIGYTEACERIRHLSDAVDAHKTEKEAVQVAILDRQAKIKACRMRLSTEEKGAEKVNQYLGSFFGHGFLRLQALQEAGTDNRQIRFEIIRDGQKAYHLSQGECSLVAFCYFVARLDDIDTGGTQPIIWIDDPVSSLDGNHVFFIYSLIAAEVIEKDRFEQIFVSTHSLDFLKYLKRMDRDDRKCEYLLVHREGDTSTIRRMPKYLRDYVTEFNYLFHEIYKCSRMESDGDTTYVSLCSFGNNARKFLEMYLYFRYPDFTSTVAKMERFFADGKVPAILSWKLTNEYSHLSGAVERASMPVELPEAKSVAKQILKRIKEIDEDQYTALVNSLP
jgi:wobble nucleotide-excising tRNase